MLDLILVVDSPSSWHRLVCRLLPKSRQLLLKPDALSYQY